MTQPSAPKGSTPEDFLDRIQALELRIENIESRLKSQSIPEQSWHSSSVSEKIATESDDEILVMDEAAIESNIGEYGLAWLGSLVLLFGVVFLMAFVGNQGYPVLASALGYASAAGVFILAHFLRKSFSHMVFTLTISGHILIYYITLRLCFFSTHPLIPWKELDLVLVMAAIGILVYRAWRHSSELLTGIALILVMVTALIGDSLHITMSLLTLSAAAALYFFYRYNWWRLLIISLIFVYLSHLLWLINNPLLGHPFDLLPSHPYSLFYLFAAGALFSIPTLIRRKNDSEVKGLNTIVLLNGFLFTLTILPVTAIYFPSNYVGMFGSIAVFCLLFSVWLHLKAPSRFVPAFFACFGFMALSISFYGFAKLPDAYFFLALQSFLVVSMALWFRSKIIVVVNSLLYLGILVLYLAGSHSIDKISFCFAFVAFATARILKLKRERLTLKTDLMRNMYLAALFFTMLYAFYHAVPERYITLSWTAVAVGYFLLSILLHNIKYRWMAIVNLMVTVVYLFLVDLANLSFGYRVVAFFFLAVILISVSLYYTKRIKKKRILHPEETPETGQS
ncbi:MAG: hypothetical protein NTW10_03365 [Bacteroidetes bacterium]|nr:hypothetical protein [Bacteroidota bacterium]